MLRIKNGSELLKRGRTVLFRRRNFKDCDMMTVAKSHAPAFSRKCDNFEAGVHQAPRHLRCRQCLGESDGYDDHWLLLFPQIGFLENHATSPLANRIKPK